MGTLTTLPSHIYTICNFTDAQKKLVKFIGFRALKSVEYICGNGQSQANYQYDRQTDRQTDGWTDRWLFSFILQEIISKQPCNKLFLIKSSTMIK